MNTYDVGDVAVMQQEFWNNLDPDAPLLVDPATVQCDVLPPSGDVASYVYGTDPELVQSSTGIYQLHLPMLLSGTYTCRWTSTGTYAAADTQHARVKPQEVPTQP